VVSRWFVIVSRDWSDLWATWSCLYRGAARIEIFFDRRQGQPWTGVGDRPERPARSPRDGDLQAHGFLVIPQPEIVSASC
jgi:hypothetical protein